LDLSTLVAANLRRKGRQAKADPDAEDRYYRERSTPSLHYTEKVIGVQAAAASWLMGLLPRRLRAIGR
jgi:hypothetical protein